MTRPARLTATCSVAALLLGNTQSDGQACAVFANLSAAPGAPGARTTDPFVSYPLSLRLLGAVDGSRRASPPLARVGSPQTWSGLPALPYATALAFVDAGSAALAQVDALVTAMRTQAWKAAESANDEERAELDGRYQQELAQLAEIVATTVHDGIDLLDGDRVVLLGRDDRAAPVLLRLADARVEALGLEGTHVRTQLAARAALALLDRAVEGFAGSRIDLELARQELVDGPASGGMSEVQRVLRRMRGLALRCVDGTLGSGARAAFETRFRSDVERIEHVARAAKYGGLQLLDGSVDVDLQGAPPLGLTLHLDLPDATVEGLGLAGAALLTVSTASAALVSIEAALVTVADHREALASAAEQLADGLQLR